MLLSLDSEDTLQSWGSRHAPEFVSPRKNLLPALCAAVASARYWLTYDTMPLQQHELACTKPWRDTDEWLIRLGRLVLAPPHADWGYECREMVLMVFSAALPMLEMSV